MVEVTITGRLEKDLLVVGGSAHMNENQAAPPLPPPAYTAETFFA